MSWDDINRQPEAHGAVEDVRTLEREIVQALHNYPALTTYLKTILQGRSYASGRDLAAVAFSEGQRALAHTILSTGGQLDGQKGK